MMSHTTTTPTDAAPREAAHPFAEDVSPAAERDAIPPLPQIRHLEDHPLWREYLAAIEASRQADREREAKG